MANNWKSFWNTPEGRVAIGAMMAHFNVYGASFDPIDPTSMAVAYGERKVCAWIAEQIGLKDEEYVELRDEIDVMTERLVEQYGA